MKWCNTWDAGSSGGGRDGPDKIRQKNKSVPFSTGIGIGLSTAILALTFPGSHGVIDFRVWKVVFGKDKRSFTVQNYVGYLKELRKFACESGWSTQKADFMIWSCYDEVIGHS